MRTLSIVFACVVVTGCATQQVAAHLPSANCFRMNVIVSADDGGGTLVSPGVPVDVVVRSREGRVLQRVLSTTDGKVSFGVCWREEDPAWQVEATLHFGEQFVGAIASFFNYADTYCLTLPSRIGGHCGEWGTGPASLLDRESRGVPPKEPTDHND